MATMTQQAVSSPPTEVGRFRRFGKFGPQYEVLGSASRSPTGAAMVRIRVHPSFEELDYPCSEMLEDPEAIQGDSAQVLGIPSAAEAALQHLGLRRDLKSRPFKTGTYAEIPQEQFHCDCARFSVRACRFSWGENGVDSLGPEYTDSEFL